MSSSTMAPPKRPEIKTALPGPKGQKIIEADAQFVTPSYPRPSFKLVAERAQGVWVEDVDGNIFLDCNAGVAVCSTGHCHPEVVRAIQDQAAQLIHMCGTDYYYRHMPELAQKLDEIVPVQSPTRTHFANSGTEAVETALKLAMHATGREKFIAFFNSFHGRTLGSLSLTSSRRPSDWVSSDRRSTWCTCLIRTSFAIRSAPKTVATAARGRARSTGSRSDCSKRRRRPKKLPAIVVEAVQGEGGYVPAPKDFLARTAPDLRRARHSADRRRSAMRDGPHRQDVCLRSLRRASRHRLHRERHRFGLADRRLRRARRPDGLETGAHASTFGGNPVCIAAALKTIELLEGGLVQNSARSVPT